MPMFVKQRVNKLDKLLRIVSDRNLSNFQLEFDFLTLLDFNRRHSRVFSSISRSFGGLALNLALDELFGR